MCIRDRINRDVRAAVGAQWDGLTHWWSTIGNTEIIIGTCVIAVAILFFRTRQWWLALVPALAISLQATVFVIAANLVNRARPDVERLDPAPPTSSYPSSHTGASFALYLTCLLYTSDAADERSSVDLGGRRIIKKKNTNSIR